MNCQGLGGLSKRKDVFNYLKQKKYSIYCLQDTHFTHKEEKYIRAQGCKNIFKGTCPAGLLVEKSYSPLPSY